MTDLQFQKLQRGDAVFVPHVGNGVVACVDKQKLLYRMGHTSDGEPYFEPGGQRLTVGIEFARRMMYISSLPRDAVARDHIVFLSAAQG